MRRLARFCATLFAAAALLLALAPAVLAFSVQPLLVELEPGSSGSIRVENTRSTPLTVEVSITRRSVDEHGQQTRTPADDDFVVLPPQLVIAPGRVQVVRLQWVGDTPPTQSISYYANLREVPVALAPTQGGAQVQLAFAFDIAVQLIPHGARADLSLVNAEVARDAHGAPTAHLTIQNAGTRYAYLQNATYDLEALDRAGAVIGHPTFTEEQLTEAIGVTLLEPGKRRIIDLPLGNLANAASLRGRVRAGSS